MSQRSLRNKLVVLTNQKNLTDAQLGEIHELVNLTGTIPGNHNDWKCKVLYRDTYRGWITECRMGTKTTTYMSKIIKKRSKNNKRTFITIRTPLTSYRAR